MRRLRIQVRCRTSKRSDEAKSRGAAGIRVARGQDVSGGMKETPRIPRVKAPRVLGLPPYSGYRLLMWLTKHLPKGLMYALAHRVGGLRYLTDRRGRATLIRNLRIVMGPEAPGWRIRQMTRQAFRSVVENVVEFVGVERYREEVFSAEGHEMLGLENLRRHTERGRGALLISGHLSNWEIAAGLVAREGFEVYVVALAHEDARISGLYDGLRAAWGCRSIPIAQSVRRTIEVLEEGKLAAYLGDRYFGGAGKTEAEFFGVRTVFPTTPARLALKAGAAYVPTLTRRKGRGRFAVEFYEAIEPPDEGTEKDKAEWMVRRYVRWLEDRIREAPAEWVSFSPIGEGV